MVWGIHALTLFDASTITFVSCLNVFLYFHSKKVQKTKVFLEKKGQAKNMAGDGGRDLSQAGPIGSCSISICGLSREGNTEKPQQKRPLEL